jgi:Ca-activated chloride channel family protein
MKTFKTIFSALSLTLITGLLVYFGSSFLSQNMAQPRTEAIIQNRVNTDFVANIAADSNLVTQEENDLIRFSVATDNAFYLANNPSSQSGFFYAELKAGKYSPDPNKKRTPLNISLVIDRSGSMEGDKLTYVKKAAAFVVDNLTPEDYLSIVIYDTEVKVLYPSNSNINKQQVKKLIATIESDGSTNLSGGMINGFKEVKSSFKPGYMNRVLLLTDGLANQGITEPNRLETIVASRLKEEAISLSTFGVGADFNEDLLQNLAEFGSGNYYFISSPDKIPEIFQKEMKGLLSVVAQNTKLTIELPMEVSLEKVYGYPYAILNNRIEINFKDLFSEETKAVLIKYTVPAKFHETVKIAAHVSYNNATMESVPLIESNLMRDVKAAENAVARDKEYNKFVLQQIALFESNERMNEAMKAVDKGEYDKARKLVSDNEIYLKEKRKSLPGSAELQRQDSINQNYRKSIQKAETMNQQDMKMMQKNSKSLNYEVRKKK